MNSALQFVFQHWNKALGGKEGEEEKKGRLSRAINDIVPVSCAVEGLSAEKASLKRDSSRGLQMSCGSTERMPCHPRDLEHYKVVPGLQHCFQKVPHIKDTADLD